MSGDPGSARLNRLARESSPYLQLHRANPVDWYPWGEEALARAASEDQPIFLSVGYSTCYWCHVMERESFSDPGIAELMNRWFVNIKLDREEHPELDEVYMTATQLVTGRGGWPNSVFLTPRLEPFFAGTYFPPEDRGGQPGFARVLASLAEAWRERRGEVEEQARELASAMKGYLEVEPEAKPGGVPASLARYALEDLKRRFDRLHGGFGGAPKFPAPSNLWLLEELRQSDPEAEEMLQTTLESMAGGGIFDQLGGGFHRYATDREWRIPHFEKMLYDNGLLLELYARDWERRRDASSEQAVRSTVGFLHQEMTSPEGAFWSAIDAETEGEEGAFYVWTRRQLEEALGAEDFSFLAPLLGFEGAPFFEGAAYVLHRPQPLSRLAERRRIAPRELLRQIEPLRRKLLERRSARPRPLTDDKVLADWNGMAVAGLAEAGRVFGERAWIERAAAAAEFLMAELWTEAEGLRHCWRNGKVRIPAFLSDYVFLARGLLALHRAGGGGSWLDRAVELTREQIERLGAPQGGFFVAAPRADLLLQSREVADGAVPGANGVAAINLLELAAATGSSEWAGRAEAVLRSFCGRAQGMPEAVKTLLVAARRAESGGAGSPGERPERGHLSRRPPVEVSLELGAQAESGWTPFRLALEIAPGWHLYAPAAESAGVEPLRLSGLDLELAGLEFSEANQGLAAADGLTRVPGYSGRVTVAGSLRPVGESPALEVRIQACDDNRCLNPQAIRLDLEPSRP